MLISDWSSDVCSSDLSELRAFLRQRLGEAVNAGFGSGVIHLAILPRLAVDRPDIDDPAPAAFAHAGKHRLRHVKAAAEIDVDDFLPHLVDRKSTRMNSSY